MQTIHMCDTYGQYLTMKAEIDAAMQEVIRSTQFIKSGKVLEFEKNLANYLSTNVIEPMHCKLHTWLWDYSPATK